MPCGNSFTSKNPLIYPKLKQTIFFSLASRMIFTFYIFFATLKTHFFWIFQQFSPKLYFGWGFGRFVSFLASHFLPSFHHFSSFFCALSWRRAFFRAFKYFCVILVAQKDGGFCCFLLASKHYSQSCNFAFFFLYICRQWTDCIAFSAFTVIFLF